MYPGDLRIRVYPPGVGGGGGCAAFFHSTFCSRPVTVDMAFLLFLACVFAGFVVLCVFHCYLFGFAFLGFCCFFCSALLVICVGSVVFCLFLFLLFDWFCGLLGCSLLVCHVCFVCFLCLGASRSFVGFVVLG